jgi:esterase/lipase
MKKFLKWLAGIILLLVIVYLAGPKPAKPVFETPSFSLPASLHQLEKEIISDEAKVRGIRPDNEARIIWADTARKEKTPIAFVYLHGFSASQAEGEPVHRDVARMFNANLYLARLEEHGIDRGDSTMINLTADKYAASAEKAYAIATQLGDQVVVIGTSGGGALALMLAAKHPEIKAIILYSPCIRLYDKTSVILDKHWGLQIARKFQKSLVMNFTAESDLHAKYWSMNYRIEALVALQNLLTHAMKPALFSKVTCPVFLGYYYKSAEEQDKTVSIPAMLKMFDELGTPANMKEKMAFPDAGAHVIASYIRSEDWENVQRETERFLTDIVNLQPSAEK